MRGLLQDYPAEFAGKAIPHFQRVLNRLRELRLSYPEPYIITQLHRFLMDLSILRCLSYNTFFKDLFERRGQAIRRRSSAGGLPPKQVLRRLLWAAGRLWPPWSDSLAIIGRKPLQRS